MELWEASRAMGVRKRPREALLDASISRSLMRSMVGEIFALAWQRCGWMRHVLRPRRGSEGGGRLGREKVDVCCPTREKRLRS